MQVPAEAYDIMEKELLPVFAEAVRVCKKISNDEDYFKKGYSRNTLYSMALLSVAIKSVTKDIASDDHKKHNISRIDLLNKRHFYQPDGSLGPSENVFNRKEVVEFKKTMRKMNASFYEDAVINECLGSFEMDAAIGMWEENPALISCNGDILRSGKNENLIIFAFAAGGIKHEMFTKQMNEKSRENGWDKKQWNANYPIVNQECDTRLKAMIAACYPPQITRLNTPQR